MSQDRGGKLIYKRKGSSTEEKNYREITILSTFWKILEAVLKDTVRQANRTGCSGALHRTPPKPTLYLYKKRKQRPAIVYLFLDVKAAFDVVSHPSLLRKLFRIGVDSTEWPIINSLHIDAQSVVKRTGATPDSFNVQLGVRLGGIMSTDLYMNQGRTKGEGWSTTN